MLLPWLPFPCQPMQAYPKRSKEISDIFSSLMRSASIKLSIEMTKFMTYFGKNFRIPPNVPLYEMRKEGEERGNEKEVQEEDKLEEGTATERIVQLNIKIITTRSLNAKLRQKIAEVKVRNICNVFLVASTCI